MQRDARLCLAEILLAADFLIATTQSSSLLEYQGNQTQRLAVERAFILIGEAVSQLSRRYPTVIAGIATPHQIIAFRNLLVHEYWSIDDETLWSILLTDIVPFRSQVAAALAGFDPA